MTRVVGQKLAGRPSNHTSNSRANLFHFSSKDFCDFPYKPSSASWRDSDRSPAGIGANPSPAAMKLQSRDESQTKELDIMSSCMTFSIPGIPLCVCSLVIDLCPGEFLVPSRGKFLESGLTPGNRMRPSSSIDKPACLQRSRSSVSRRVWHSFMTRTVKIILSNVQGSSLTRCEIILTGKIPESRSSGFGRQLRQHSQGHHASFGNIQQGFGTIQVTRPCSASCTEKFIDTQDCRLASQMSPW